MPHDHRFDPISGYCLRCGYRDDGRLVDLRSGREYRPGPEYTTEQLTEYRRYLDDITGTRTLA